MVVFLGNFNGVGKDSKKEYFRYTLLEVQANTKAATEGEENELTGRVYDFFADAAIDVKGLECGTPVKVEFEEMGELDGRRRLVSIERVGRSVFRQPKTE